jgi:HTH-type transcriptional regulator / antitoxin HipB
MDTVARIPQHLRQAIKARRAKLKLAQAAVGAKMGMKQNTISVLEIRTASSRIASLFKVLSALGLEIVVREKSKEVPSSQHLSAKRGSWNDAFAQSTVITAQPPFFATDHTIAKFAENSG